MISRSLKQNVLSNRGRIHDRVPFAGGYLSEYLPEPFRKAGPQIVVTLNGARIPQGDLDTTKVADGDWIGGAISPGGVVEVVFAVVTIIISVWQAYDATRRAKIQGHHAARRAAARAKQMGDSATYGWGGIQNTINEGTPIPPLFGLQRIGGQIMLAEPRGAPGDTLDILIGISEGECQGPVAGTVELNGKPEGKFSGLTIASRTGTNGQSAVSEVYSTAIPRVTATPGTSIVTTPALESAGEVVDAYSVEVTIAAATFTPPVFALGATPMSATVDITFQVRHRTLPAGSFVVGGTFQTGAKVVRVGFNPPANTLQSVPLVLTFKIPTLLAASDYEIEVSILSTNLVYTTWNPTLQLWSTDNTGSLSTSGTTITVTRVQFFREFAPSFPGLALLGVSGISAASVGGALPTITSIWEGRKLRDIATVGPPATFDPERYNSSTIAGYTLGRNPALVILDILTNTRYGAGEFIDVDNDLDIQAFVDARDFCDRLVSRGLDAANPIKSGSDGAPAAASNTFNVVTDPLFADGTIQVDDTLVIEDGVDAGTFRVGAIVDTDTLLVTTALPPFATVSFTGSAGVNWHIDNTERFALCDFYVDGSTTIWKAVASIAQNARLAVVRSNGQIRLIPDEVSAGVVAVFSMGNIQRYKHFFTGKVQANRVEVQFLDAANNYEQAVAQFEDPEALVIKDGVVRTQMEAFGVTRRSQATRIAKYHWLSNQLEQDIVQFDTDAAALALEWGDIISVQHDASPQTGPLEVDKGGRLIGTPGGLDLELDQFYTFDGSERFAVQSQTDDAIFTLIPTSPLNVPTKIITMTSFFGYVPTAGDVWNTNPSFVDDPATDQYRVVSITRSEDHRRKVKAVKYHPDLFQTEQSLDPNSLRSNADIIQLSEINE